MSDIVMPRNFILLEELENLEKGKYKGDCSIGLIDMEDIYMHHWNGLIITDPNRSNVGEQFVNLQFYCSDEYPFERPKVKIDPLPTDYTISCNSVKIVDDDGYINDKMPIFTNWNSSNRMIDIIKQLKTIIERGKI